MSGDQPPPPGWGAPGPPSPGWQQQPPGWGPPGGSGAVPGAPYPQAPYPQASYAGPAPPVFTGAAHKPGAIPLRPLALADIFDGAFRIIRYNPKATIGAAVLVSAVAMVPPLVVGLITGSTGGLRLDPGSQGLSDSQIIGLVLALGSLLLGTQLQAVGLLFVSGMIAHVASAAAVGRKLTMGEAWAATGGKRWRLFGMAVLLGLGVLLVVALAAGVVVVLALTFQLWVPIVVGLVLAVALFVGYVVYWVRLRALAVPALMLEPVGIAGALGRAFRLSHRQFWRLLGILLLVTLVVAFAGSMLRLPFTLVGQLFLVDSASNPYGVTIYLLLTAVGTVVSAAVLQPFQAAAAALLYVDQRIRKEAYDVELLGRAGILTG